MRTILEQLYRTHRQGLYSLALSITGRTDRAEDAIHDAFTRLWTRGGNPAGDPAAYVFSAVRNASIDQLRKAGRDRAARDTIIQQADGRPDRGGGGPVGDALDAERQGAIRRAIDRLNEEQREVIVMKVYGGLTFDQIAQAIGSPLSTVASRYRRGLARLENGLEKWL